MTYWLPAALAATVGRTAMRMLIGSAGSAARRLHVGFELTNKVHPRPIRWQQR